MKFKLHSNYQPRGDQPVAIDQLYSGVEAGEKHQVLLGVTGSGKTFTMAKLIEQAGRTAMGMANKKTLAGERELEVNRTEEYNEDNEVATHQIVAEDTCSQSSTIPYS